MKFTPRLPRENVNISKVSPLRELFVLLSAVLGGVLIIYFVLGVALDIIVSRMPDQADKILGTFFSAHYNFEREPSPAEKETQKLLDDLVQYLPPRSLEFTVRIADNTQVNAMALPGGHILVFSGLISEIQSENELAMVLAHELGHFVHRDHLRGLGRRVVLVLLSVAFFGVDSPITELAQRTLATAELRFSRAQEEAADNFALHLLNKKYGHVAGATDFFDRLKDKQRRPRFLAYFSTHPHHRDRVVLLEAEIRKSGYIVKEKIPLLSVYKEVCSSDREDKFLPQGAHK